jgi:hypothetical protein
MNGSYSLNSAEFSYPQHEERVDVALINNFFWIKDDPHKAKNHIDIWTNFHSFI